MAKHDPLVIPRYWKWLTLAIPFALGLLALALVAWLIWEAGAPTCESQPGHSDQCDSYLPGVPGQEGSHQ